MPFSSKDLETRFGDWGHWGSCESNSAECLATGTTIRTRSCFSKHSSNTPKDNKYCVGPSSQNDWCEMPCYGKMVELFL